MALAPEPSPAAPGPDPGLALDWLTRASDLLRGAFDDAPVGLFLTDPVGGVRWCNATWRDQFDVWGPVPVRLDLWIHRLSDEDRAEVGAGLRSIATEGATMVLRVRRDTGRSGTPRILRLAAGRAEPDDPRVGIVGAVTAEDDEAGVTSVRRGHDPTSTGKPQRATEPSDHASHQRPPGGEPQRATEPSDHASHQRPPGGEPQRAIEPSVPAGHQRAPADNRESATIPSIDTGVDQHLAGEPDEDSWAHRARHDPLTDLPNRLLLGDHLGKALARCERDQSRVAVLFLDIDRFKSINDNQGHEAGDALLCQMADRLSTILRPSDTVARLGGDEFVVLLDRVDDEEDALVGGRRITAAVEGEPFPLPDMDLKITISAGIALSRPGIAPATLMREADTAMYRAKERGRARLEIYDEVLRRRSERRVDLAHQLLGAIEREELTVHYQPCADLRTGRVVAVEALARWPDHDNRGEEFIKVAEDSGLIVPLGEQVLRQACTEARTWDVVMNGRGPRVHVNLSARQLGDPGLLDSVAEILTDTGIRASALCLEVPENALAIDPATSGAVLVGLKQLGVQLAIDDFGTASSSLPHLRDLAIDHLKIDRSFVAGLGPDPEDSAIVAAIISITHSLNMEAVAEGVETVEQVAELKALDCDVAQGFLFSHPVTGRDLVPYLDHVYAV